MEACSWFSIKILRSRKDENLPINKKECDLPSCLYLFIFLFWQHWKLQFALWIPVYGKDWSFGKNPLAASLLRDCLYSVFVSVEVFAMTLMYRWNFISYSTVSLPHILISKYRNCYLKMKPVSCFLSRIMGDWWSIIAWWTIPLCYSANNSVEIFRTKQNKLDWATWISSLTSLAWRCG